MNPILKALYWLFKVTVRLGAWIYYPDTVVLHGERLRFKGPALVVSNHPNTLMDALNTASHVRQQVFFLANAGLFSTPFTNWLFNTLYCIPIQRTTDTGGKPLKNDEAFARCDEFLGKGGALYIAPEGTSWMDRQLRPFKTGTARIAFSAESQNNYELGLIIQPVGLSYGSFLHCGGRLVVHAAEPIRVADFRAAYEEDPQAAVRALTILAEDRTRGALIQTKDEGEDTLARRLESILQNEEPLKGGARFYREKNLTENLAEFHERHPGKYAALQDLGEQYFNAEIRDSVIRKAGGHTWVIVAIGFLPWLYGYLNHVFAVGIPKMMVRALNVYIGYTSTIKFSVGALTVPLFYGLQTRLVAAWAPWPWFWVYLLSLPVSAWWLWRYNKVLKVWEAERKWGKLSAERRGELKAMRQTIIIGIRALQVGGSR